MDIKEELPQWCRFLFEEAIRSMRTQTIRASFENHERIISDPIFAKSLWGDGYVAHNHNFLITFKINDVTDVSSFAGVLQIKLNADTLIEPWEMRE